MQQELPSRAPIFVQSENLPIFRGVDVKKAGTVRGPAFRAGRRERRALGDLGRAGKAPPAGAGGKAKPAESVQGSKGVAKPSYLSERDWIKCCEWAKDGVETASFTGNDVQRLAADKHEERIRKKVEKALGTLQVSMDSIYDIDVPSKISMADPDDETKFELDPEFLPSTTHLSSRLDSVPEVIKQIRRKRKEFPETNPLDYYLYLVISLDSGLAGKISCSLQLVLSMWGHFGMAREGLHNAFAPYVSWTTLALILSIILLPTF